MWVGRMTAPAITLAAGWQGVPGWLAPLEAGVLEAAVRSTDPAGAVVECGTWCGRSLLCMSAARDLAGQKGRPVVSYDPYPARGQAQEAAEKDMDGLSPEEARRVVMNLVGLFNLENVHLRSLDAVEGARDFARLFPGAKVSLLYLDDHHTGERVLEELAAWEPLMAPECEVCIHDFPHEPYGIEPAVDRFMLDHPEWVAVELRLSMFRMRRRWKAAPRAEAVAKKCQPGVWGNGSERGPWSVTGRLEAASPPAVSVLYNTWRLGGLDCLKAGLDRQTAHPSTFEVVIVDALYPYRWREVAAYFANAPYRVLHVNPTKNPFPRDHGNRARNDAIRSASGEVCVWWCDFSLADRESLARHHARIAEHGERANSCGTIIYGEIGLEALLPDFRAALPLKTIDDYVDLCERLPAGSPLWISIFSEPPLDLGRKVLIAAQCGHAQPYEFRGKVEVSPGDPRLEVARDARREWHQGPAPSEQCYYAKNEATARSLLVRVNGWEETFDDGHACDDLDICRRFTKAGAVMVVDKGNECFVPNPRPFFPLMRWTRPPTENRKLFDILATMNRPRAVRGLVDESEAVRAEAERRERHEAMAP